MARTATLLARLAAGANAQQDSGQFPQGSDRWSLMFRHFSSVNGDAVYCECIARARVCVLCTLSISQRNAPLLRVGGVVGALAASDTE